MILPRYYRGVVFSSFKYLHSHTCNLVFHLIKFKFGVSYFQKVLKHERKKCNSEECSFFIEKNIYFMFIYKIFLLGCEHRIVAIICKSGLLKLQISALTYLFVLQAPKHKISLRDTIRSLTTAIVHHSCHNIVRGHA